MYNFLWEAVLIFTIYIYDSERKLKHFGLGILVMHKILANFVLNIFKFTFWYICIKIRKEKNLNYSPTF